MSWRRSGVAAILVATLSVGLPPVGATAKEGERVITPVDLNSASVEELTRLPGIGPSKARAIASQRTKRRFRRPEDIIRVPGIGRKTYRRLRPFLRVSAEPLPSPTK